MEGDPGMNLIEYPDRDMMMIDVANMLAGELGMSLRNRDRATFAVPGGTTPGPMFEALCAAQLDWDRVDVMLTDERWVDADDPRSNARLLRETLLVDRAAGANFVPFFMQGETPASAAPRLTEAIGGCLPVSVLLLGMGDDMHTASLFPRADGLLAALDAHAPPVVPIIQPGTGEPRVTLTAPVLTGAISSHVLIAGATKREALERARHCAPEEAPIQLVLSRATIHWSE